MSQLSHARLPRLPAALFLALVAAPASAPAQAPTEAEATPFALVQNDGQWHEHALFRRQSGSATAWFVRDGWVLDLGGLTEAEAARAAATDDSGGGAFASPDAGRSGVVVAMRFEGASPRTGVQGDQKLRGYYNFLLGRDPKGWHSRVPGFQELEYTSVQPGIDAVVRAGGGLFAYDLHVAPGASLSKLVIRCEGQDRLTIDTNGDLVLATSLGELRQSAPIAWQVQPDGRHASITARFVRRGAGRFGFEVTGRDPELPLVIDPDLTWGSYFGGTGHERIMDVFRTSGKGPGAKILLAGGGESTNYPTTTGAYQRTMKGVRDAYLSHVDPSQSPANQLIWSTYVGGKDSDYFYRAQTDRLGQVTAVGFTISSDYPVTATALKSKLTGTVDGVITRLKSDGTALIFSTLWGGSKDDWICDMAMQPSSAITVVGYTTSVRSTTSQGLPVKNGLQSTLAGGQDAFVSRIDPALSSPLVFSTYLGGTGTEGDLLWNSAGGAIPNLRVMGMDLDAKGRILLTGSTGSKNFPTTSGAFQTSLQSALERDAFLSLIDPSKAGRAQLVYSSYLGGGGREGGMACAFADRGRFCVAGGTDQAPFPTTPGAYDRKAGAFGLDWFVTWLDPAKTGAAQLSYSTRLGSASTNDAVAGLFVDDCGVANLAGFGSKGFPTTAGAYQTKAQGLDDAIFARLAPTALGTRDLIYSTRYGGGGPNTPQTFGFACAPDGAGGAFLAGYTVVATLPIPNGRRRSSGWEGFAAHLWGLNAGVTHVGHSTPVTCAGGLLLGAQGAPTRGNQTFRLASWNTEANATGILGLGIALPTTVPLCGAVLRISPGLILGVAANARGEWSLPAPIPATTPLGTKLSIQAVWSNSGCCLTTSNALTITVK